MSLLDLDPIAARPGKLACACETYPAGSGAGSDETWRLAAAFAFAVVAQALAFATLPLVGSDIAPRAFLATLPVALVFLGAAGASLFASLLLDPFGRRAAFALGASLGTAGGLLAGWAILTRHFPALCLGAVWLGIAQGFSLFYRHAAACAFAAGSRAALRVLAGGCLASLVVPAAIWFSRHMFGPFSDAALMLFAGIASFAALPILLGLPHRSGQARAQVAVRSRRPFLLATIVGAGAWFVMAHAMAAASSSLIACGIGAAAAGGFVSWHLVAMYGPMAAMSHRRAAPPAVVTIAFGVGLLVLSLVVPRAGGGIAETALIATGVGWSLCQVGASRLLHDGGGQPRSMLALHDSLILAAALLGAVGAAIW